MSVKSFLATKSGQMTALIVIVAAIGLFAWWLTQRHDAGMIAQAPAPAAPPAATEGGAAKETVLTNPPPAEPPAVATAPAADVATAPAETAAETTAAKPDAPKPETAAEAPADTASATAPDDAAETVAPTFDLVRVDEDGDAVLAGRAAPGAQVEILVDGEVVAETVASGKGEFVATANIAAKPETQEMQIRARSQDVETVSVDPILILGRAAPAIAELPAAPAADPTAPSGAARTSSAALPAAPTPGGHAVETAPDAAPRLPEGGDAAAPAVAESRDAGAAPVIAQTGLSGVSLLQPAQLQASDTVTLDAISYSKVGAVRLSGRGHPGRIARIYANDRALAEAAIGADGTWNTELSNLMEPGRYVLRVDEIGADGKVTSRVESPFQREYATDLEKLDGKYIVQPGNSLWRIARVSYGRGVEYTVIYDANRDRIKNPDLIYPGQVFDLPNR